MCKHIPAVFLYPVNFSYRIIENPDGRTGTSVLNPVLGNGSGMM